MYAIFPQMHRKHCVNTHTRAHGRTHITYAYITYTRNTPTHTDTLTHTLEHGEEKPSTDRNCRNAAIQEWKKLVSKRVSERGGERGRERERERGRERE